MVTMRILIINGPNLNMILQRNESHYGEMDLNSISEKISQKFPNVFTDFFTSNNENEIIEKIQKANISYDGLIINPGAYTHNSIAIRDALEICKLPKIEVHLSNLSKREEFRRSQITTSACDGYISGFKYLSYLSAVFILVEKFQSEKTLI